MSKEKSAIVDISSRLDELVKEKTNGIASKFADSVEINSKTFHTYLNGRTPNADVLFSICRKYNVNLNWLVAGIGPKYITAQGEPHALDPDPEIADLMKGAQRVLTSGNPIAFDALERNIRYFDHAIAAEKRADEMAKEIQEMKDDFKILKAEMDRLKRENLRIDMEAEEQLSKKKVA